MRRKLCGSLVPVLWIISFACAAPVQWSIVPGGNGHVYEVVLVAEGITWVDANSLAEQDGGHLATITSQSENDFVFSLVNDGRYWNGESGPLLGGYQLPGSVEPNGGWVWVTGEPFVYSNWGVDQPNNKGNENCIHFGWGGGGGITPTWNDLSDIYTANSTPIAYVVEYEVFKSEPIEWSVSEGGSGHRYQVIAVPGGISWNDAKTASEAAGGHLVTITSQDENDFVFDLVDDDIYWGYQGDGWRVGAWIGAYQEEGSAEPDGGWNWITGEPFEYANWMEGQPNNNPNYAPENENVINFGFARSKVDTWNDRRDYSQVYAYVIEFPHRIVYVDADAVGANDGTSWENAYWCLQGALAVAQLGDEIRVAQGVYKPDQQVVSSRFGPQLVGSGDRTDTFQLVDGVAIKGGYAGVGEPLPSARDIELYETVLSGDLSGNDADVSDPCDLAAEPTRTENSYHILTGSGTDVTALLDGFTISGGNADGEYPFSEGGGLFNGLGSPTLTRCRFVANSSIGGGGGVANESSSPQFSYCDFDRNATGGSGGGMGNANGSAPILDHCTFIANSAVPCGGGVENVFDSCATLLNCTFIGNSAGGGGGAMENTESGQVTTSIIGCTFVGNRTSDLGGAVLTVRSRCIIENALFVENRAIGDRGWGGALHAAEATVSVSNCTFTGNVAANGSSLACTPEFGEGSPSDVTLTNCILWDGIDTIWSNDDSTIAVTHSNVQGVGQSPWPGEGNIKTDPLFADPDNGDFHLKSRAGRWDSLIESWVTDDVTSPCIDAGDPDTSVAFEPFPNGGTINMGAYGGTAEASKSP